MPVHHFNGAPLQFFTDALNQATALREASVSPKPEDLHGAAIALVRLQDTYLLNVTELADGHFTGVDHSKERGNYALLSACPVTLFITRLIRLSKC